MRLVTTELRENVEKAVDCGGLLWGEPPTVFHFQEGGVRVWLLCWISLGVEEMSLGLPANSHSRVILRRLATRWSDDAELSVAPFVKRVEPGEWKAGEAYKVFAGELMLVAPEK